MATPGAAGAPPDAFLAYLAASRRLSAAGNAAAVYSVLVEYAAAAGPWDAVQYLLPGAGPDGDLPVTASWRGAGAPAGLRSAGAWPGAVAGFHPDPDPVYLPLDSRRGPTMRAWLRDQGVAWCALVPLRAGAGWLGSLALIRAGAAPDPPVDLHPLSVMAAQAAARLDYLQQANANGGLHRQILHPSQVMLDLAHALRTPLNAIIGFAGVILKGIDGPVSAAQSADLATIQSNGRRLLHLIDQLLDVARIADGRLLLAIEEVDALRLAQEVVRGLGPPAAARGVALPAPPGLPPLQADPARLRQALRALLTHALVHAGGDDAPAAEGAAVSLQLEPVDAGHVRLIVQFPGGPIAAGEADRLFDMTTASRARAADPEVDHPLALPIAWHLIRLHQGTVRLEEAGGGRVFVLTLPAGKSRLPAAGSTAACNHGPTR